MNNDGWSDIQKNIKHQLNERSGHWKTCSGCYETLDGHQIGDYLYSEIFQCTQGAGCHECGGLGVTWDNIDYEDYASWAIKETTTNTPIQTINHYCHKRRGTEYQVIGNATLQTSTALGDNADLVIYKGDDGKIWAREKSEFLDGRFDKVAAKYEVETEK